MHCCRYSTVFSYSLGLNMYFICGIDPGDDERSDNKSLYTGFNTEGNIMLFGGNFRNQKQVPVGQNISGYSAPLAPNLCLMRYRGGDHVLSMPCGKLQETARSADDESIF